MKILFLTFNYPPDLGAGSFRSQSLVETLAKNCNSNDRIDVITTFPHRYKHFSQTTYEKVKDQNLIIHRVRLPNYFRNNFRLIINFIYYAFFVIKISRNKKYDIVFTTSSRLLTGFLGACISSMKKTKYYLDLRDIFLDNINEIYPKFIIYLLYPFVSLLERFMMSKATKVNLVSAGFSEYFLEKYPNIEYDYFTNGIDDEFLEPRKFYSIKKDKRINILYAGNIGKGQGLSKILPKLSAKLGKGVIFRVIGDGGEKSLLINEINKYQSSNIELIEPIERDKLLEYYQTADILFLHLNNVKSFERVLPSKIFEYGAIGKPIFAGLKGYSRSFLSNEIKNSYIFDPCDVDGALNVYKEIKFDIYKNSEFIQKYLRSNISKQMVESIKKLNEKH